MNRFRSWIRGDRGAVAVEFALILPVLLMVLFGTIEFGRVYSQYQVFNGAAREGARCAAVQGSDFSGCNIQTEIDDAASPYSPASDATVTGACIDESTIGQSVTVSWEQPLDITIPFWGDVTVSPTIEATFRCE